MSWFKPVLNLLTFGKLQEVIDDCKAITDDCNKMEKTFDRMEAKLDEIELRFRERQRLAELYRQEHPDEFNERGEWIRPQLTVPFNAPSPLPPNPFAGVGRKVGDSPQFSPCDPLGPL